MCLCMIKCDLHFVDTLLLLDPSDWLLFCDVMFLY